jgi:hypothetical protein
MDTPQELPAPLAQGLRLGQETPAGIEITRADTAATVALVYGDTSESKVLARAIVHITDIAYAIRRAHAYAAGNSTDESRRLKRLLADVYAKATGHRVDSTAP